VMQLESEVARLRDELDQVRRQAVEEVQRTHRQYRRDLVPVNNSPQRWLPVAGLRPAAPNPSQRPGPPNRGPGEEEIQNQMPLRRNRGA